MKTNKKLLVEKLLTTGIVPDRKAKLILRVLDEREYLSNIYESIFSNVEGFSEINFITAINNYGLDVSEILRQVSPICNFAYDEEATFTYELAQLRNLEGVRQDDIVVLAAHLLSNKYPTEYECRVTDMAAICEVATTFEEVEAEYKSWTGAENQLM